MIDNTVFERLMRDANPVQHTDDLDPDEFGRFLATIHTRRSAIMQTPTQDKPRPSTTAPTARRRVWAFAATFIATLLVIGATTLVLRGGDTPVTNEPATPITIIDSEVPTTVGIDQSTPVGSSSGALSDGWQQVAVGEPWIKGIVDIDALPGGGFFVAAIEPWTLHWSPDGVEWLDADPQQLMAASTVPIESDIGIEFRYDPVAVVRNRVVILNRSPIGVWVGDPRTGSWELVPLDTTGLDREARVLTVGASDTHAMVIAEVKPGETAAWLVDLANGTSQRHILPTVEYERPFWAWPGGNPDNLGEWARVEWFNGRWLVMPSCGYCSTVYVSTDGANWVESEVTWAEDAPPLWHWSIMDEDGREGFWPGDSWANCDMMDMASGPDAIVGSFFAHPQAYSEDGFTWLARDYPEPPLMHSPLLEWPELTYSESLGYVALSGTDFIQSEDGKTWRSASQPRDGDSGQLPFEEGIHLTASSDRMLIVEIEPAEPEPHVAWLWLRTNN